MTYKNRFSAAILVIPFILAGCNSSYVKEDQMVKNDANKAIVEDPYATTSAAGEYAKFDGKDMTQAEIDNLSQLVYYFDFDKSLIKSDAMNALKAHAKYLSKHPSAKIRIEGHTDERGSREYNVALGERRAQAIARLLTLDGAEKSQIDLVSYGQEKPALQGHDESAWKFNRRAIIVYEATS